MAKWFKKENPEYITNETALPQEFRNGKPQPSNPPTFQPSNHSTIQPFNLSTLFQPTIYDRYIFWQVFGATVAAILLFTVVWIAPEMLLNTIKKTLSGEFGIKTAVLIIYYELPKILGKAFPVGLLLGSLFTFDKLSKDSELTIFRAVGLSFQRIVAPVVVLSLIVTALCFVTYDRLIPAAAERMNAMWGSHPTTQYIYTRKNDNGIPDLAVIVSRYRDKKMENVMVLDFSAKTYADVHQLSNIYYAKSGTTLPDKWQLNDITHYKISSDGIFFDINKIKEMDILQGEYSKNAFTLMTYATKKEREINNHDLYNYIKLLKKEGLDEEYRYMLNKYLQRFFHPFVCVLLAVMGCLLGFSKPREQRMFGFIIAICCIFLYYITLPFFDLLAEKGIMHPFLTAIFPPAAFLCAIAAFYKSKEL
jgi:lipopolysaccharide export system permease protein